DVTHRQDARRRSGLTEALVVLAYLFDEIACCPDVDASVGVRVRVSCMGKGEHRRAGELVRLEAVIRLANRSNGGAVDLDLDHARDVRPAEEGGGFGGNLPGLRGGRLPSAEDEVDVALLLDCERERA